MADTPEFTSTSADTDLMPAARALVRRLPAYARLYMRLLREDKLSARQRALALGALAYTISPIDLVPGIIPVIGQMDDLAVALIGLRVLLGTMPPPEAEAHLTAAGLTRAQLDEDLNTLRVAALALGRKGLRLAAGATLVGARRLARAARRVRGQPQGASSQ